ncbi:MAG: hypothetical protein UV62_C0029G0010 [Parcubacteria group bacterium GW2011_GWC1_43_11]|nr:MAG: hypothetical protein UV62_C0029G0010 [Parcubacteria group bacterium GW2011_GWC1_43_11]
MKTRSQIAMKILETIGGAALETSDILLAIMTSSYGSSHSRIERRKEEIQQVRGKIIAELKEKQKLYNLISYLKKGGLVIKKRKSNREIWGMTEKGEKELKKLKTYYGKSVLPPRRYKSEASDSLTIIAFDIPEKERQKRDWLRRKLIEMKFKLVQGSVWAGKRKIPEDFVEDLNLCKLLPCVEIFTVSKTGTLDRLFL